jgi:hypothetical protein
MMQRIEKILGQLKDDDIRSLSLSVWSETGSDSRKLTVISPEEMRKAETEYFAAATELARAKLTHIRLERKIAAEVKTLSSVRSRLESAKSEFEKELNSYRTYLQDNSFLRSLVSGGGVNPAIQPKIR